VTGPHRLGDQVRGEHLADPRDDVAARVRKPDENPAFVALVADPGDKPLRLEALEQLRNGVAPQAHVLGLFADRQRSAG